MFWACHLHSYSDPDLIAFSDECADADNTINLNMIDNTLVERSQLSDYAYRGQHFLSLSFVDFCVNTFDTKLTEAQEKTMKRASNSTPPVSGRQANTRARYRPGHPATATHIRVAHSDGHRYMPSFIGASFASEIDVVSRPLYLASMLILFCPWTTWDDVILWSLNWDQSFNHFINTAPTSVLRFIHNTQLERECKEAAQNKYSIENETNFIETEDGSKMDQDTECESVLDDDNYSPPLPFQYSKSVQLYASGAIQAGMHSGILPDTSHQSQTHLSCALSTPEPILNGANLMDWLQEMDEFELVGEPADADENLGGAARGDVIPGYTIEDGIHGFHEHSNSTFTASSSVFDPSHNLNSQQLVGFNILCQHLSLIKQHADPPQLLMKVMGAPGTGKSHVIDAMTSLFAIQSSSLMLRKAAHQGSAAVNIGGVTLYSLLSLRVENNHGRQKETGCNGKLSVKRVKALIVGFEDVHYLIIDEISQVRIDSILLFDSAYNLISSVFQRSAVRCLRRLVVIYRLQNQTTCQNILEV